MAFSYTTVLALSKYIKVYLARVISITDPRERMTNYIEVYSYFNNIRELCKDSDPTIGQPLIDMLIQYEALLVSTQANLALHPASAVELNTQLLMSKQTKLSIHLSPHQQRQQQHQQQQYQQQQQQHQQPPHKKDFVKSVIVIPEVSPMNSPTSADGEVFSSGNVLSTSAKYRTVLTALPATPPGNVPTPTLFSSYTQQEMVYKYSTFDQLAHAIQDKLAHATFDKLAHATESDHPTRTAAYVQVISYYNDIIKLCQDADPTIGQPLADVVTRYENLIASAAQHLSGISPTATVAAAPAAPTSISPKKLTTVSVQQ